MSPSIESTKSCEETSLLKDSFLAGVGLFSSFHIKIATSRSPRSTGSMLGLRTLTATSWTYCGRDKTFI